MDVVEAHYAVAGFYRKRRGTPIPVLPPRIPSPQNNKTLIHHVNGTYDCQVRSDSFPSENQILEENNNAYGKPKWRPADFPSKLQHSGIHPSHLERAENSLSSRCITASSRLSKCIENGSLCSNNFRDATFDFRDIHSQLDFRSVQAKLDFRKMDAKVDSTVVQRYSVDVERDKLLDIGYRLRYGLSNLEISSRHRQSKYSHGDTCSDDVYRTSAAAAFFARASQKLKLNSSPHKRKRRGSAGEDGASTISRNNIVATFSNTVHRNPPPVPPSLLRKIDQKENIGVGKVKVLLKVCSDETSLSSQEGKEPSNFNMDKKRKQITLYEPANSASVTDTPQERKLTVSAPKMFAFDALFSEDDALFDICGNALTDIIHAVINGSDGCTFCFGNVKSSKLNTMLGNPDSASSLGIMPCAIAWLYRAINEQKHKTGARFSIRVSAVELTIGTQHVRDLLADYVSDAEQSPGVYLKDDPILGSHLQNRSELRAPLPEKAAFYLDVAQNERNINEETHFLYTLHVYQYTVANKGAVAGGRSRLHLIDLAGYNRNKPGGQLSITSLGNVLLAIFNGQKHVPNRELKITQILKECLSSLTCHVAMIAHVSPLPQHYHETLAIVQLASRIHRIRRRKVKFVGVSNGINTTTDENGRLTSSSDFDPSSSEQSADTVIYVGPSEETDGEHPPVHIPNLNSADNRGAINKVLKESSDQPHTMKHIPISRSVPASPQKCQKTPEHKVNSLPVHSYIPKSKHLRPAGFHSAHSSPVRCIGRPPDGRTEEQWIDGPRVSKSRLVEARNVLLSKKDGLKKETWVDGPKKKASHDNGYGFMDSHKKNMIWKWVENQSVQIRNHTRHRNENSDEVPQKYKVFTTFKTYESDAEDRGQGSGQEEEDEERNSRFEDKQPNQTYKAHEIYKNHDDISNHSLEEQDEDVEIEIVEIEDPEEPVPMQDCGLQVTEEDIAYCMGQLENPLPEVDQEEHPLRVLSQENMTVVSTFTDSLSVVNDLERLFPRSHNRLASQKKSTIQNNENNQYFDPSRSQLLKLHELYENKMELNSCFNRHANAGETLRAVSRCQSLTLSELCNGAENNRNNDFDNSSIASEPAYVANDSGLQERLCENCKGSLTSVNQNIDRNGFWSHRDDSSHGRLQSYRHLKNIMSLRHPDGASNPNLQETESNWGNSAKKKNDVDDDSEDDEEPIVPPLPLSTKLLSLSREGFDRTLFNGRCNNSAYINVTANENLSNGSRVIESFKNNKGNVTIFESQCEEASNIQKIMNMQEVVMDLSSTTSFLPDCSCPFLQ